MVRNQSEHQVVTHLTVDRWKVVRATLAGLVLLGASGCERAAETASEDRSTGGLPPARVTAARPERKTLVRTIELPGRVEAFEVAPLHAKVTGYVERILVDIGDTVQGPRDGQPGAVLCELLVPELREDVAQKAAVVAQTQALVAQADAGVKLAEAALRSAAARVLEARANVAREEAVFTRWQSEFQRVSQLADSGAVNKKLVDETQAELAAAAAGRQEVTARIASVEAAQQETAAALEKAQADADAVRAQLAVAQADQRRVEAVRDYAVLRAPFDGVVVERNVHTGHLVQAGGNGHPPLLAIMRQDPVRVIVDVPEADALHIAAGSKVELRVPSMPGAPQPATVTRTSWSLDATARTLTAEIDVPNADGRWRPGLYLQIKVVVAELPDTLCLPKTAIVTHDKQTYCFVVDGQGQVARQAIELGLQAGNEFAVRNGLIGEEQVITVNASAFRDGQVVEIAPPAK